MLKDTLYTETGFFKEISLIMFVVLLVKCAAFDQPVNPYSERRNISYVNWKIIWRTKMQEIN